MKISKVLSRKEWKLFLIGFLVVLFYTGKAGGDMGYRYLDFTYSIVYDNKINIDKYHTNTNDYAFYKGHYYNVAAPGLTIISLLPGYTFKILYSLIPANFLKPLESKFNQKIKEYYIKNDRFSEDDPFVNKVNLLNFFLFSIFIVIFTGPVLAGFYLVIINRTLKFYTKNNFVIDVLTFTSFFGTILFFYSTVHHAHMPSAVATILSFYYLTKIKHMKNYKKADIAKAGISAGFVILLDFTLAAVFLGILFYALLSLKSKKEFFMYALLSIITVSPVFIYNWIVFDSPLNFPYKYVNPLIKEFHQGGYMGLSSPKLEAIYGLTFSSWRGLFFYMPILLLCLYASYKMLRKPKFKSKPELYIVQLIFILLFLFYSSYKTWHGAWSFGPRFLISVIPLLFIPIAYISNHINRLIFLLLSSVSIFINWLGVQHNLISSSYLNPLFEFYIPHLIINGPTSRIINYIQVIFNISNSTKIVLNLISLITLIILIIFIWKYKNENSNISSTN